MFQKFKITFYSLIVLLVLTSQANATPFFANSCKGWDCSHENQVCREGADGARGTSFICYESRWEPTTCDEKYIERRLQERLNERRLAWHNTLKPWYCGNEEKWK